VRYLPAGILACVFAALLVAGCSAGHPVPVTSSPGRSAPVATPSAASAAATASPGRGVTTGLAAPTTSGQLHVVLHDAWPVSSSPFIGAIGAEAPDGSVFAAFGSQQSGAAVAPAGSPVYVVDGDQPAQIAEHPAIPVAALAADDTNLYVGGGSQILEYARATGALARIWSLAQPVRLMAASAGQLWVVLGSQTGSGLVVEIDPGASGVTTVGTDSANVTSIAAGPLGLYYVESGGATIVHITPEGTRHLAPTHQTVNQQLSGPAAVQAVSVIGDQLLLAFDAGQGLDSSSHTYDATTLAGPQASAPGSAGSNRAIDSLAGPVDRVSPGSSACSGSGCVGRYNLATGAVTDAVTYPGSTELGPLLGPYPAVFVFPSSGPAYLDRIG
jgi:hypothetical protein